MKSNLILVFILITFYDSIGQTVSRTMKRLPDTGQKNSYTNTFGEDNDYSFNVPFYIKYNNGTTLDTVTGLLWQTIDGGEMSIENARLYCDTLTLGGYTDWRLPNPHEAFSILNHQNNNPAVDVNFFTKTAAEYWWTSLNQSNDNTKIWCTNAGGGIGNHPKAETISAGGTKKFHVRAVRDLTPPTVINQRYTDNGDGSITDHLTNLVWQKIPNASSMTWEDALVYAEGLNFTNKTDWRLPNIKELQSLNDESTISPSVYSLFSGLGIKKYWSSTSLPNQTTKAWYWDTQFGITTYDVKTNLNYVLCVRNNYPSIGMKETTKQDNAMVVYPNPFQSFIGVKAAEGDRHFKLCSALGVLIYEGVNIEEQDFSYLPKGIYILQVIGINTESIRLAKTE